MGVIDAIGDGPFSIFGCGRAATGTAWILKSIAKRTPRCFVVTNADGQAATIMDRPVLCFDEYRKQAAESQVKPLLLIAIQETGQQEIVDCCIADGIPYFCITSDVENELSVPYYRAIGWKRIFDAGDGSCNELFPSAHSCVLPFDKRKKSECTVYLSKCIRDVPLLREYDIPAYVAPVQAGTALADRSIAKLRDNQGDNISSRNPYYCELTVLYWVWKNALHGAADYLGLCHYRRIFALTQAQMSFLLSGEPDAVLLYPSVHLPNAGQHERRYIPHEIAQVIREALKNQSVELWEAYEELIHDKYLCHFNMLIAEKNVFNAYCEWLFMTIKQIEDLCRDRGIPIEKRQQGYWAEILMSCYFLKYRNKYDICYVGHKMLL